MVKASKGLRRRSRNIMRKNPRNRGNPPVARVVRKFEIGERVSIRLEPSELSGAPHLRFQGRTGEIVGTQGRAYRVRILDGNKEKIILSNAVHLIKAV